MVSTYTCFTESYVVYIRSGNWVEILKGKSVVVPNKGVCTPREGSDNKPKGS